mmetsp:Transcript_19372/g.27965  ORF Transcript_19372/g.27965 Transcript_19372/m.27965 type:complete len:124 (+) Transcript_19372:389-760(+)
MSSGSDLGNGDVYMMPKERTVMLDRYNSHTKSCKVCLTALAKTKNTITTLRTMSTVLLGATGSLLTVVVGSLVSNTFRSFLGRSLLATIGSLLACYLLNKRVESLENKVKKFYFVDYVHSTKD